MNTKDERKPTKEEQEIFNKSFDEKFIKHLEHWKKNKRPLYYARRDAIKELTEFGKMTPQEAKEKGIKIDDIFKKYAKLFDELGPRYKDRPGGYLRVIKRGYRPGDKAPAAQIEFVKEEATGEEEGESLTEETA